MVYVRHLRTVEPGHLLIAWEGEIERMVDGDSSIASRIVPQAAMIVSPWPLHRQLETLKQMLIKAW